MSEPWEAELFRSPDIDWQTQPPPARHAVPARYVPGLDAGDEVTIGLPGRYYIDGQVLTRADRTWTRVTGGDQDQESLAVAAPYAYWLAQVFPQAGLTMQWWPVALSWVYRDAVKPGEQHPDEAPPAVEGAAGSWLDHVQPTLDEPPVRHPKPARDAGALTGRTLRLQHQRGAWSWWIAVSEPTDQAGEIVVHVMRPRDYWIAQVVFESAERAIVVPLYRLHVYE